jgi:hypothetical protein
MPTACRQSSKKRLLRGRLVEMERLRIKVGRESLDLLLSYEPSTRAERLSYGEVFEIYRPLLCSLRKKDPGLTERSLRFKPRGEGKCAIGSFAEQKVRFWHLADIEFDAEHVRC